MHLKSLSVRGFKSFASVTMFEFEPGLNAIVGPNGSGKSNVVDALAWVLGAQGASALRGGSMKDVIFAGGSGRPALGRARVELVIDNTDGSLALPYTEISLARTMFSAGGSDYEINGNPARLSDVQELLSDAGLGRELHSLVGQGQLDKILHGSAADRRELIEEAAGLVKYRKRQSKTATRLEAMKGNLDRLEDVASELSQQLEGRREQAEAARSASAVATRVRSAKKELLVLDAQQLESKREEETVASERTGVLQEEAHLKRELLTQRLETLAAREKAKTAERDILRELLIRAESVQHRAQTVELIASERLKAEKSSSAADDGERLEKAQATWASEKREAQRIEQELNNAQSAVEAARDNAEGAERTLIEATENLEHTEQSHTIYREEAARLTGELALARAAHDRAEAECASRRGELEDFADNAAGSEKEIAAAWDTVTELKQRVKAGVEAEASARTERVRAASAEQNSLQQFHQAEVEVESLSARCEALKAAMSYDLTQPALRDAIAAATSDGAEEVASLLTVKKGWEKAVGVALGQLASALVGKDGKEPEQAVSALFNPHHDAEAQLDVQAELYAEPGVYRFTDLVEAPESLQQLLLISLGNLAFCDSDAQARRLIIRYPQARLVSQEATARTSSSVFYPADGAGAVELYSQLAAATQELHEAQIAYRTAQQSSADAQRAHQEAAAEEQSIARTLGADRKALAKASSELAALQARAETTGAETSRLSERAQRAIDLLEETGTKLQAAIDALDSCFAQKPLDQREKLTRVLTQARADATETSRRLILAQSEHAHLVELQESAEARVAQAKTALEAVQRAQERAQKREEEGHLKRARAVRAQKSAKALLAALADSLGELDQQHEACQQAVLHLREEIAGVRQELDGAQKSVTAALTLKAEAAATHARLEAQWEALESRAFDELGQGLKDVLVAAHQGTSDEADSTEGCVSREQLEQNLAAAEKELKRLGVVNPLALEEFEALKQRHDYLQEQIRDLKNSRSDLRAVMKDISKHIEKSFEQTFTQVQKQFEQIFAELFPGGVGQLVLADPTDPQNSGIDLQVRPAGKKVSRLSLLSGGERSLASLALLLAIFMTKPAPFYVLDEVEAALDDRNLGRLLGVLERLKEISQLIMVTHHQRTMSSADTLYGISMREGVSTVISQRGADVTAAVTEGADKNDG